MPEENPYEPPKAPPLKDWRVNGRTPTQRAFDRCMVNFALVVIGAAVVGFLPMLSVQCVVITCVLWMWIAALAGVLRTWSEPDAKVARFASLGVLFFSALGIFAHGAALIFR